MSTVSINTGVNTGFNTSPAPLRLTRRGRLVVTLLLLGLMLALFSSWISCTTSRVSPGSATSEAIAHRVSPSPTTTVRVGSCSPASPVAAE